VEECTLTLTRDELLALARRLSQESPQVPLRDWQRAKAGGCYDDLPCGPAVVEEVLAYWTLVVAAYAKVTAAADATRKEGR